MLRLFGKRLLQRFVALATFVAALSVAFEAAGCTSSIVGIQRGEGGRWLLWKHRDTSHHFNYVKRVEPADSAAMSYVALFNSDDADAREAWIGFNEAGLAVMNTASYNIEAPEKGWSDREGMVMSAALARCSNLRDFYRLLTDADWCRANGLESLRNDRGALGVQANFGAVDAAGHAAYFETTDFTTEVYPLDSVSAKCLGVEMQRSGEDVEGVLTRTNYCLSGGCEQQLGMSRHRAEKHLLDSLLCTPRPWAEEGKLAAEDFTEVLSRSFYMPAVSSDLLDGTVHYAPDNGDVIPRYSSSASVVIEGPEPDTASGVYSNKDIAEPTDSASAPGRRMTMWVLMGFPPLAEVRAVKLDSVPADLLPTGENNHCTAGDAVQRLRGKAFINRKQSSGKQQRCFNLPYLRKTVPAARRRSLNRYRAFASPTNPRFHAIISCLFN